MRVELSQRELEVIQGALQVAVNEYGDWEGWGAEAETLRLRLVSVANPPRIVYEPARRGIHIDPNYLVTLDEENPEYTHVRPYYGSYATYTSPGFVFHGRVANTRFWEFCVEAVSSAEAVEIARLILQDRLQESGQ